MTTLAFPPSRAQTRAMSDLDLSVTNADILKKHQQGDLMRWLSAKSLARQCGMTPAEYFTEQWPRSLSKDIAVRSFELSEKAATAAGSTTVPAWGGVLVGGAPDQLVQAFIPLLQAQSAVLQLPLARVPFSTTVAAATSSASFDWVAELAVKSLSKFAFSTSIVPPTKIAGNIALSEELMRLAVPGSLEKMQTEMVNGATAFIDAQFLDPAVAAVVGETPASITNGVTPVPTGATVPATISALVKAFWAAAPNSSKQSALVMSPATASAYAGAMEAAGIPTSVTIEGGTVSGLRIVTTPGAGNHAVALDPTRVLIAREPRPVIDTSGEASIQMDSQPIDPVSAAAVLVSAWQMNMILIRCEWAIGWVKLPNAVQYAVMP